MIAAIVVLIALTIVDMGFYAHAKWPERASSFWYKMPGGGFVAYWRGRDK